jgi:uncharacterized SAM-binding protein YcdF (DUF218 family)
MSALLNELFSVSGIVICLLVAALWVWRRPSSRGARRFLLVVAISASGASIFVVPYAVSRLLTHGYRQFSASDVSSGTTVVVVLGSGDEWVAGWSDHLTVMKPTEAERILEAYRVFRLISPEWIISSGGRVDPSDPADASSTIIRAELIRLGVPPERIVLESASRDTYDEAMRIAPMLRTLVAKQLVLVTSDTHMRRALGAFRAVGWNAVAATAPDHARPPRLLWWVLPSSLGLELSAKVMHELAGIPYYWLRGWWRSDL